MICNNCNTDKEDSNFQTYWHSSQNKFRTRKQCNECFYSARQIRKNPDKYYSNLGTHHKCKVCEEWKEKTQHFYFRDGRVTLNTCKRCESNKYKQKRAVQFETSCGGERVPIKVNTYTDRKQKECTFYFMESMGYLYNEEIGVWLKEGTKELIDGKVVFPKVKTGRKMTSNKVSKEMVEQMITLYKRKWGCLRIANKLNISSSTVHKYLVKWKELQ